MSWAYSKRCGQAELGRLYRYRGVRGGVIAFARFAMCNREEEEGLESCDRTGLKKGEERLHRCSPDIYGLIVGRPGWC